MLPDYYTEKIAYLGKVDATFDILHTSAGVTNEDVKMPFTIGISKSLSEDLTVELELEVKGKGLTKENVVFKNGSTVTIPAGESTVSNELQFSNWDFAIDNKDAATYELNIRIAKISPSSIACIAVDLNKVTYRIEKSALANVKPGEKPVGTQIYALTSSSCIIKVSQNISDSEWNVPQLMDDMIPFTSDYMGIKVDLRETKLVTGLYGLILGLTGATYPSMCSIETSDDGQKWIEQMAKTAITPGRNNDMAFVVPIETRYIRWRFWGAAGSLYVADVSVYVQE